MSNVLWGFSIRNGPPDDEIDARQVLRPHCDCFYDYEFLNMPFLNHNLHQQHSQQYCVVLVLGLPHVRVESLSTVCEIPAPKLANNHFDIVAARRLLAEIALF